MAQQLSNQRIAWFNGKFMPENQVLIPFRDRSWKYGDGAFDMTRTFNGQPFRLKEHIDRFYRSLRYLRIDPGMGPQEMVACQRGDRGAQRASARPAWRLVDRPARQPRRRCGRRRRLGAYRPERRRRMLPLPLKARPLFRDGLDVITPTLRRIAPDMLSPRAKTHNYLNMIVAEQSVKAHDPDAWAVLLDDNGNLAEGMGSNIFIVREGELFTPGSATCCPASAAR